MTLDIRDSEAIALQSNGLKLMGGTRAWKESTQPMHVRPNPTSYCVYTGSAHYTLCTAVDILYISCTSPTGLSLRTIHEATVTWSSPAWTATRSEYVLHSFITPNSYAILGGQVS